MKVILERILLLSAAVCVLSLASCKKKEDNPSIKYFSGQLSVNLPAFAAPGETIHLSPGELKKEDGTTNVGYFWKVSGAAKADTVRRESDPLSVSPNYDFTVPDTTGTLELMVGAFANDYFSLTATGTVSVVKGGLNKGSLTNFDLHDDDGTLLDKRDNRTYLTTLIGETEWMRQNLAYEGCGTPYSDIELMNGIFGRFYTWEEANNGNVCPEGWAIPSEEDWVELANVCGDADAVKYGIFTGIAGQNMVDARFNGRPMWEFWPQVVLSDSNRFAALPLGFCEIISDSHKFRDWGEYAGYWTSDEFGEGGTDGVYRYFHVESDNIFAGNGGKSNLAMNVRCIKKN